MSDNPPDHFEVAAEPDPADAEPPPQPQPEPDPLAFTPVPRLRDRSNGWNPEVQRAFIAALAETGSVRAACRRVGRSDHGAYQLRRHPEGASLRAAWDAALDLGIRRIEDAAMDRALYGVEEAYFYHGELRGRRRRYNERLVMFMLRNRAPHRFATAGGARGLSALDKAALARLKAQWRAEWEREDAEEEQATLDSLDSQLETMRRNRWDNMSPRARAAYAEAERIAREDGIAWMSDEADGEPEDDPVPPPALPSPPTEGADSEPADDPPGPRVRSLKGDWD